MKTVSNINEYKALNKGQITPRFLADNLLANIGTVKSAIIITVSDNNILNVAYSETQSCTETLGMLEYGKDLIKESLNGY